MSLKIYDVLGREVSTLVNEVKQRGSYETTFNAAGACAGTRGGAAQQPLPRETPKVVSNMRQEIAKRSQTKAPSPQFAAAIGRNPIMLSERLNTCRR